jgi:hypothetical protein
MTGYLVFAVLLAARVSLTEELYIGVTQSHNMPLFLWLSSGFLYHRRLPFISSVQQHLAWKKDEEYQGGVFYHGFGVLLTL